jgi:hypothetical protein
VRCGRSPGGPGCYGHGGDDGDRRGRRPRVAAHEPVLHGGQPVRRPERIDPSVLAVCSSGPASQQNDQSRGRSATGHGLRRSRSPRLDPCPRPQGGQRCAARSSSGVAAVRRRTSPHATGRSCSPLPVLDHVGPSLGSSGAPDTPPLPRTSMRPASLVLESQMAVGMPMLVRLTARHKSRRNG